MDSENPTTPTVEPEQPKGDSAREISAATIGRMLGLATNSELKLLDGKLDLLLTKINNLTVRLEKMSGSFGSMPTTADIDRLDVQLSTIRGFLKENGAGPRDSGATTSPATSSAGATTASGAEGKPRRPNVFVSKNASPTSGE